MFAEGMECFPKETKTEECANSKSEKNVEMFATHRFVDEPVIYVVDLVTVLWQIRNKQGK